MIEKLLENWLDSASERSYQPVFVQMLAAEGYTVLHSTRHCTLEYGKDILAIDPNGIGCAFQLKGDPSHSMNVTQFREMLSQLVQLIAHRPAFPGFPPGEYRSYLVSNGQFAEEVQVEVDQLNSSGYASKLVLWSRGHLLDMCKRHGAALWPSEIGDNRALLEIYMSNSRDPVEIETLNGMLASILALGVEAPSIGKNQFLRVVNSAAWATGICLAPFMEAKNHYAVAMGWGLCHSLLMAAAAKHAGGKVKVVAQPAELCRRAVLDALTELWAEVDSREHLTQNSPIVDAEIYGWRVSVIIGLLSTLAWADHETPILDLDSRIRLHAWLSETKEKPQLWGEGAVAQLLPWILFLCNGLNRERGVVALRQLVGSIINANQSDSELPLSTPHYSYENIARNKLGLNKGTSEGSHDREDFAGGAFTADALMRLLVLFGLKDRAIELWPNFSRLGHRSFQPAEPWHYLMYKCRQGIEVTRIYPSTYSWDQLYQEVINEHDSIPLIGVFRKSPWQLFLWWQVAPHRVSSTYVVAGAAAALALTGPAPTVAPRRATRKARNASKSGKPKTP